MTQAGNYSGWIALQVKKCVLWHRVMSFSASNLRNETDSIHGKASKPVTLLITALNLLHRE